ncbi:MAG: hypothetical protein EOS55_05490 [Mesorhizobium sp.]|nr:MAG: hypothetical protein EOS55_05490 [Mesorhizobium sp.]
MRIRDQFRCAGRLALSLVMIFLAPGAALAQTTPAKAAEQVAELLTVLKSVNLPNGETIEDKNFDLLIGQLLRLRAAKNSNIIEIDKVKLSSALLGGSKFSTDFPASAWPRDLILEVKNAATYFDGLVFLRDPTQAILRRMEFITAPSVTIDMDDAAVRTSAMALLKKLTTGNPASARARADVAQTTLKELLDDAALKKVLLEDKDIAAKLAQLRTDLMPFAAQKQPRIHIVSALYGDIGVIDRILQKGRPVRNLQRDRWCIASAAAAACERLSSCQVNLDFKQALCGYDPAPFMSSAYKALVVIYECRNNDDAIWTDGVAGDGNVGIDRKFVPPQDPDLLIALLYGKDQSFKCAPPLN